MAGSTRPEQLAAEGLELALASGDLALEVYHRHILGFVALSRGDAPAALGQLTLAAAAAEASGTRHPGRFKLDGDRVEAAVGAGDIDRGRADRRLARARGARRADALDARSWPRGAGASSTRRVGMSTSRSTSLDGILRMHDGLPMPFERGRTLLAARTVHRRRKEKRLADERLREALAIFERWAVPSGPIEPAPSSHVSASGPPHQPPDRDGAACRRARRGRPVSRQIAERAFLAPKTVGNVLGRVYEKLGIHPARSSARGWGRGVGARDRSG